jgi:hypothetical protein
LQARDFQHAERLNRQFNAWMKQVGFRARLGVVAVAGNTDRYRWTGMFDGLPVHILDQTGSVQFDQVQITGLSAYDSFDSQARVEPADRFHIVLGHSPNFALGRVSADLLVAGHTHGGQVRLPLIGPLVTFAAVPRAWAAGVTDLGQGRHLIVSRGVGMERGSAPRLRFLCRPEIVVVDLRPLTSAGASNAYGSSSSGSVSSSAGSSSAAAPGD